MADQRAGRLAGPLTARASADAHREALARFEEIVDLDSVARAAALGRLDEADPAVLRKLRSLLVADELTQSGSFLQGNALDLLRRDGRRKRNSDRRLK